MTQEQREAKVSYFGTVLTLLKYAPVRAAALMLWTVVIICGMVGLIRVVVHGLDGGWALLAAPAAFIAADAAFFFAARSLDSVFRSLFKKELALLDEMEHAERDRKFAEYARERAREVLSQLDAPPVRKNTN